MVHVDTKGILASKSVWGAATSLLASLLQAGLHFTPAQSSAVLDTILQVVTVAGTLMALYGRIVATKQLVLPAPTTTKEK